LGGGGGGGGGGRTRRRKDKEEVTLIKARPSPGRWVKTYQIH